jgi:hypothetical protein
MSPDHIQALLHRFKGLLVIGNLSFWSEYPDVFAKYLLISQDRDDTDAYFRAAWDENAVHRIAVFGSYFSESRRRGW